MIFASDLDRTLIYSSKFLDENVHTEVTEWLDGKIISYVTPETIALLKKVHEKMLVIPVTTRNRSQFARIELFGGESEKGIKPRIHIVNNGGTLYIDGEEDQVWTQSIEARIKALEVQPKAMMETFLERYTGTIQYYKASDDLLWLIISNEEDVKKDELETFKQYANPLGWDIMNQGRKTYLYPSFVNKWEALSYIKKVYPDESMICAGDSEFDFTMVHQADYGITPKEAFIEALCEAKVYHTQYAGFRAAEEILAQTLEWYEREEKEKSVRIG